MGRWGSDQNFRIRAEVPVQENLAGLIHDADIHRSCMQVDATVELVLSCVESHKASSLGRDSCRGNYAAPPGGRP